MAAPSSSSTTDPAMVITDAMIAVDHELSHLPAKVALQLIEFSRRRLDASEARILADRFENGATDREVADMAAGDDGKTSKKEAKKRASRAKATNANPGLADKMAAGDLSTEQADVVAEAAAQTNGAAACDAKLIDEIAGTTPEQGRKKARKYVNDRLNGDDVQRRHDKQRRQRGYYRHRLPNGNDALTFHGDTETIDEMERSVNAQADHEYQADGGRDVPSQKHPRSSDQRCFDAAHHLISRSQSEPDGSRYSAAGQRRSPSKPTRAVLHIKATVDQVTGKDSSPIMTADGKPLPRSVVDEIACNADIIGHIFSADGELLWQTVKQRLATTAQINGLIARDGGCVLCDAHYSNCVAHHLLPWEAPERGETNIDNLALLCGDCHTRVHQRKWTLFYHRETQTWKTRPAKPHEIPHQNPHNTKTGRPRLDELRQTKRLKLFDR